MPTIDIPDKICPHCGGTKWYVHPKQTTCYNKMLESNKRYHKSAAGKISLERARAKERENLSDNYVRQAIYISVYNTTGDRIQRKSITKEQIDKYRNYLKFLRTQKLTSYGNKTLKHEKTQTN